MKKLTDLLGQRVRADDGTDLGRVWDVRAEGRHDNATYCRIDALICGPLGLLERLGLQSRRFRTIAWTDVLKVDARGLTVRLRS